MRTAIAACVVAVMVSAPAFGLAWQVTDPDPSLAGAGIVEIEYTPDKLEIEIHKWWQQTLIDPQNPDSGEVPLIIRFTKGDDDPDVIHIIDEMILNVSEIEWSDYHLALLDERKTPVVSQAADVFFVNPDAVANWDVIGGSPRFASQQAVADGGAVVGFNFDDGIVGNGTWVSSPLENQLVISNLYIDWSALEPGEFFYLKQVPTVPEPASLLLLLGSVGLLRRRMAS